MNASYIYSDDKNYLINYIQEQKENYQLIIVDSFVWSFGNTTVLEEIQRETHLITIGNDEQGIPLIKTANYIERR